MRRPSAVTAHAVAAQEALNACAMPPLLHSVSTQASYTLGTYTRFVSCPKPCTGSPPHKLLSSCLCPVGAHAVTCCHLTPIAATQLMVCPPKALCSGLMTTMSASPPGMAALWPLSQHMCCTAPPFQMHLDTIPDAPGHNCERLGSAICLQVKVCLCVVCGAVLCSAVQCKHWNHLMQLA